MRHPRNACRDCSLRPFVHRHAFLHQLCGRCLSWGDNLGGLCSYEMEIYVEEANLVSPNFWYKERKT